jgi:hypothetical protein
LAHERQRQRIDAPEIAESWNPSFRPLVLSSSPADFCLERLLMVLGSVDK